MMDINKELQEEMDASKVLFIIKKTLKGTVLDHINSFALLLDDVKKLADEMPDSAKEYFVLDRVQIHLHMFANQCRTYCFGTLWKRKLKKFKIMLAALETCPLLRTLKHLPVVRFPS